MLLTILNLTLVKSKFLGLIGSEGNGFIRAEVLNIKENLSPFIIISFLALYIAIFLLLFALAKTAKQDKKTIEL